MRISEVRLIQLTGEIERRLTAVEERQVGALDLYPDYRQRAVSSPPLEALEGSESIEAIYVEIDTDDGLTGRFGPLFEDQAMQIGRRLRPHLLGRDPLATELLWDVMARHDRHGRKGYMMMAISAVDIALWDIRGQAAGLPVYRLLGGPTREAVPAYASALGYSLDPERVRERARAFVAQGYRAQKWFFRYGPGDGRAAIASNLELVRVLREAVGDEIDLMFDCWMGWDVPFAIEMGRRMAPYHPRWLEEPVQPDRPQAYAAVRRATGIPIAGGEHEYTRWGFKQLLDAEALDVVQADPDWAGGITEMTKIIALTSAYDRQVIPHGHSVLPALHLIAAQSPAVCPLLEYLVLHNPAKQWFHRRQYVPENGSVALPQQPGLGLEYNEARIAERRVLAY